mgnify:CR=1 FL=1
MLKNWQEIKQEYPKVDLLLGNGFSLNFSDKFHYDKLFEEFLKSSSNSSLYRKFRTSNFELIMSELQTALKVNDYFKIDSNNIQSSVNELKDGLLKAIAENHPQGYDIDELKISSIIDEMKLFSNIFTLNYDLLLYRILMRLVEQTDEGKNSFWGDHFEYYDGSHLIFKNGRNDILNSVFYLHGSLFIFRKDYSVFKIKKGNHNYSIIEDIKNNIKNGFMPVIITEGTHGNKLKAIKSNYYLNHCYTKLIDSKNPILIYGTSLSEQDKHIIEALNKQDKKIIFSIHKGNKSKEEITKKQSEVKSKFGDDKVDFVYAESVFNFDKN